MPSAMRPNMPMLPAAPACASRWPVAANRTGRLAGEHAATGAARQSPAAHGTSIVRVFGKSAGITGLSLRAARKAGLDARAVHITGNHHAGYFPGAEQMLLKLVYENGSGRVLGAQAVGGAGVDKRLDIIATLMYFHGTVHHLAELDLAYAPPFGSAKDPVHMAAFAAENDLDGLAPLLQPDTDLAAYQVVDVRDADEIAQLALAQAAHAHRIPLDDLRERLGELDPALPTVVACQAGLRSYMGTRILAQHGFGQVFNLSGAATVRDLMLNRRTPLTARARQLVPTLRRLLGRAWWRGALATCEEKQYFGASPTRVIIGTAKASQSCLPWYVGISSSGCAFGCRR